MFICMIIETVHLYVSIVYTNFQCDTFILMHMPVSLKWLLTLSIIEHEVKYGGESNFIKRSRNTDCLEGDATHLSVYTIEKSN